MADEMTATIKSLVLLAAVFLATMAGLGSAIKYVDLFDIPITQDEEQLEQVRERQMIATKRPVIRLTVEEMCNMPPDRGTGCTRDIVRVYYNPVVQQCLPFSWSGEGGNANRFVSIKNCYEVCHPSDPTIRIQKTSGLRPYIVHREGPRYCGGPVQVDTKPAEEMVVRKIRNPADPSKTLTIVQPVKYVNAGSMPSTSTTTTIKPKVVIEERVVHGPMPYYMFKYLQNPFNQQPRCGGPPPPTGMFGGYQLFPQNPMHAFQPQYPQRPGSDRKWHYYADGGGGQCGR